MYGLKRDLRHALRSLARTPAFTLSALLVLSLGIGSSVAIYSVVDHILLRPLKLPDSERIVTICERNPALHACVVSTPNLLDWSRSVRGFTSLGAARTESFSLRTDDRARSIDAGIATAGFLPTLGIAPARGRLFTAQDGPPVGAGDVVVVSDGFWRDELGGDPDVLGHALELDGKRYTVIGVLPPEAVVPRLEYARVWLPLPWDPTLEENRDWRGFVGIGRLAPGVSPGEAAARLRTAETEMAATHPDALRGWGVDVLRMRDFLVAGARPLLLVFLAAVVLVLLLVVANMAGLFLVRGAAREREMLVRRALGAGGVQMVEKLLTESVLVAVLGGLGGVFVAVWAVHLFIALAPSGIPRLDEVGVDGRALLFAAAVALGSGVVFGLAPALRLRKPDLRRIFRSGRGVGGDLAVGRTRRRLVIAQLALALVLVTGAGLLLRSFASLVRWRPGFDTEHVLTFWLPLSTATYPKSDDALAAYRRIEASLRTLPGVRGVGTVSAGPLFGGGDGATPFLVEGRPGALERAESVAWYDAGPDYFSALGQRLLRGRFFTEADDAGAPAVAVVNRAFAERTWPDGSPIGARITLPRLEKTVSIVGVVENVPPFHPGTPPEPEIYFSNRQQTRWATYFVLRTRGDPAALARPAVAAVKAIDANLDPSSVSTMSDHVDAALVGPRFSLALVSLFAILAAVLGVVGVYGLVAYGVEMRKGEFGVRLALGATPRRIVAHVLRDSAGLVAVGALLGLAGALLAERLLAGMIFGVSPRDAPTYLASAAILALAALAAAAVPAARAARADPAMPLRNE